MLNNVSVVRLKYILEAEALVCDFSIHKGALCAPGAAKFKIWRFGFRFVVARASDQEYMQFKQENMGVGTALKFAV